MATQWLENIDEYERKIRVNAFFITLQFKTPPQLESVPHFNIDYLFLFFRIHISNLYKE